MVNPSPADALASLVLSVPRPALAGVLATVLSHVPERQRDAWVQEALRLVHAAADPSLKAWALGVLHPLAPAEAQKPLQEEIEAVARELAATGEHLPELAELSAAVPELADHVLDLSEKLYGADQADVLARLAPHVSERQAERALDRAMRLETPGRALALARLLPHLPRGTAESVYGEALAAALDLRDPERRTEALCALVASTEQEEHGAALLEDAMASARTLPAPGARGRALVMVLRVLPEGYREELVGEILSAVSLEEDVFVDPGVIVKFRGARIECGRHRCGARRSYVVHKNDRGRRAALEHHRTTGFGGGDQQLEILRVARADLQHHARGVAIVVATTLFAGRLASVAGRTSSLQTCHSTAEHSARRHSRAPRDMKATHYMI